MGSAQSSRSREEDDDDDEEEEEEEEEDEEEREMPKLTKKKILEQEPEILPCRASASPLSPQLSAAGTPRVPGGAAGIKVWDPCNVLAPPQAVLARGFGGAPEVFGDGGDRATEVFLISHGECSLSLRPDLVGGRWPAAGLTSNGERQARALAVFLNSQGVRFSAVYTSPLDRAMATATAVCRELGFSEEKIQSSDSLVEMSQGQWEGCHRSEVYTPEMISLIDRIQPDFCAPSGESLRQVEFRMVEFLNRTILRMPDKLGLLTHYDGLRPRRRGASGVRMRGRAPPFSLHAPRAAQGSNKVEEGEEDRRRQEEEEEGPPFSVLTSIRSQYNDIVVVDTPTSRVLLLDSTHNVHSILNKGQILTNSYWDEFATLPAIIPRGPIAILGLGGGTVAHLILNLWPSLHLIGWEIDEILIEKAREYFGLSNLEKHNHAGGFLSINVGDALSASMSTSGGFAGIIVDLFSDGKILPQLQEV